MYKYNCKDYKHTTTHLSLKLLSHLTNSLVIPQVASQKVTPKIPSECQHTDIVPTNSTAGNDTLDIVLESLFSVGVQNSSGKANISSGGITSARTSVFYPLRRSYVVGETVAIRIRANDEQGRPQQNGGDFRYVLAASPDKLFRTVARVVDHHNGSYSAFFVAPEVGTINLKVTLVHPSDAVRWLKDVYMKADGCFTWGARYVGAGLPPKQPGGQGRCVVKRGFNQISHPKLCFYGANTTGLGESALICTKPEGFQCDDIRWIAAYHQHKSIADPVDELLEGSRFLFNE